MVIIQEKSLKKMNAKTAVPRQHTLPKPRTTLDKDPKTLFKMSKFQKVPPKIVSHRPEDDPAMLGCQPTAAQANVKRPTTTLTTRSGPKSNGAAAAAEPAAKSKAAGVSFA
eukprot:jgi/Hompol1/2951/HPOL_006244-RA